MPTSKNDLIVAAFEKHCQPGADLSRAWVGRYSNPVIEDFWRKFKAGWEARDAVVVSSTFQWKDELPYVNCVLASYDQLVATIRSNETPKGESHV